MDQLYNLSEVLREMPSYMELLQAEEGRTSHFERLKKELPEIWDGIKRKRSLEAVYTFIPEIKEQQEIRSKENKSITLYNAMQPINGIKLFSNDGQPVCAVTVAVKYSNNQFWSKLKGDKFGERSVPKMVSNLSKYLIDRSNIIEEAKMYYNLWKAPDNVLMEFYNKKLVVDKTETFKQIFR